MSPFACVASDSLQRAEGRRSVSVRVVTYSKDFFDVLLPHGTDVMKTSRQ
jgi:hypothetical protein